MLVDSWGGIVSIKISARFFNALSLPKEVTVNCSNSPHLADLSPHVNKFDPDVGIGLDDHIGVVGKLWRRRVRIVVYLFGHHLLKGI